MCADTNIYKCSVVSGEKRDSTRRIVALLQFHNDLQYLSGWFDNLRGRVDAVVALDDGSTDGGGEYIAAQPETAVLLTNNSEANHVWNEPQNRRRLVAAGQEVGADWFLAIDADERLSTAFWRDVHMLMEWADGEGNADVLEFRWRELWNAPDICRVDGVWGVKSKAVFFRNIGQEHRFDPRLWHGEWYPIQWEGTERVRQVPYALLHLRMIHAKDRALRRARYSALDPHNEYQAIGYDYLTDENGIVLRPLEPDETY